MPSSTISKAYEPCFSGRPAVAPTTRLTRSFRKRPVVCSASQEQSDNIFVRGSVAAMTGALKILGVGQQEYQQKLQQVQAEDLAPGDVKGVMERIAEDYTQRAYILTGDICDSIYAPDCYFADPTVKFSGLDTWRRNLQLLVPFLQEPRLDLLALEDSGVNQNGEVVLKAQWRLRTYLRFPWLPLIDILGSTEYTLNDQANKIVRHVEAWNVSGVEAIMQMFKPSGKQAS